MNRSFSSLRVCSIPVLAIAMSGIFLALSYDPSVANFGDPCSRYVKGSKKWKKCKNHSYRPGQLSTQDERFMAGYWLAKSGRYQQALDVLAPLDTGNDPYVLNYIGYATRKLGRVEQSLVYYRKAIALAPDYVVSRAYLGEAFLALGNRPAALRQLAEIARRCGTSCQAYKTLKTEFARSIEM